MSLTLTLSTSKPSTTQGPTLAPAEPPNALDALSRAELEGCNTEHRTQNKNRITGLPRHAPVCKPCAGVEIGADDRNRTNTDVPLSH